MILTKHIAMYVAEQIARKSNCQKRKVAFVVFNQHRILAAGVNQHSEDMPCKCVTGIHDKHVKHAEIAVLDRNTFRPEDEAQAVVTYAPCLKCAERISQANIHAVHIKHTKHVLGINHLTQQSIDTHQEWLTPMQRVQAAWLAKNVKLADCERFLL